MCAILGMCSSSIIVERDWLSVARDSMSHRGPDDHGEWWSSDGHVGFGHRRLSIVDLSSFGHQPMTDVSGMVTVVFNGEIYNYKKLQTHLKSRGHYFRSDSDTEVILESWKEWGDEFVLHLNGMFAIAIYDHKQKKLILARDRAGEKPLYYMENNRKLLFSSELKGLMLAKDFNPTVDHTSLDIYLSMGYVPGDMSILKGVSKLQAGHILTFKCNNSSIKIKQYWDAPTLSINNQAVHEEELVNKLDYLIESSVRMQLSADVPVGVLLSGGVDSSLVTAMAARTAQKVKTFTVTFPGNKKYDESAHAALIAEYFSTDHIELEAEKVDPDILTLLARQFDEPICDSSMIPTYLVSQLVKQHCKVALGGDGGDELFGGYHHYSRLLWTKDMANIIPDSIKRLLSMFSKRYLPTGFKGRNWLQALATDFSHGLPQIASYFDLEERNKLLLSYYVSSNSISVEDIWQKRVPDVDDLLQRATLMDFKNYMVEDILVKVDRSSMLNSLEVRAPLLDYRIIDFAFGSVPSSLKATSSERKILLKRLAKNILPPSFDFNRKQGFAVPLDEWLKKGKFKDFFYDVLLDANCFFDRKFVHSLISGQENGRYNSERLFSLVMFELWMREYSVSMG